MKQFFKILLLPFSVLYGLITFVRNKCYDWGVFRSVSFDIPIISVGNLNTGGTGKSPAIEYLIRLLQRQNLRISTLSRGYGRKTKGFIIADNNSNASVIGDEPLQFFQKFNNITVSVCEDRVKGIKTLLEEKPVPEVVLLDDAFQHRRVKPGLSILLTDYNNLYLQDCILPSGRLREFKCGARRADIIIITKSPETISVSEKKDIISAIHPKSHQCVLFSTVQYKEPVPFFEHSPSWDFSSCCEYELLLFTGIANPKPLITYLSGKCKKTHTMHFGDHHTYSQKDIENISQKFRNIASAKKVIVTTEKDFSRLVNKNILNELSGFPLYYIPVEMVFSEPDKRIFEQKIINYVDKN
ncbi:MAG TPA: tetraacyldisaccharide 4'-kinase [Bacteroidales bacterium]|nr:tetraacyldisaccharide 4'-kinase [Bacteroidales bacterium]